MNSALAILCTVVTVYFLVLLFTLWAVSTAVRQHLDKSVILIRAQRNEDLRWHRDSLLAHLRVEQARKS